MLLRLSVALFFALTFGAIVYWRLSPVQEAVADPDPNLVAAADDAFQQGTASRTDVAAAKLKFAHAADLYSQLTNASPSPNLFVDLGNASLLADRLPEAIFAYQRGLQIAPDDEVLRRHLRYARVLVAYGPSELGKPSDDVWPLWLPVRTLLQWGALAAYALSLFLLVRTWITRCVKPFVYACSSAVAFVLFASLPRFFVDDRPLLVIAHDNVPLQLGNGPSYSPHPELPFLTRGMEARLVASRGDWIFLQTATGQLGWVPVDAALSDSAFFLDNKDTSKN